MVYLSDLRTYQQPLKTKPKDEEGFLDYAWDSLATGVGRMAEDAAGIFFRKTRGDRDPEEYRNDPDFSSMRALEDWGREVRESHAHEYEPQTWQWYLNQVGESIPESLAIMGGSAALGSAIAPSVGTAGGAIAGALRSAPMIGRGVSSLGKAIQAYLKGNGVGSRVARAFTPDARTFSSAIPAAYLEAEAEAQGVYNQAIDAGMSVEDAERAAADSRAKNFGIISFMNMPAYKYLHGVNPRTILGATRPVQQGLLGKAGEFAGYNVLPEGIEEALQSVANQSALPFGYDPQEWLDSFIVGGIMGGGMGGVSVAKNRIVNGAPPSYEEQLEEWQRANERNSENEANKYARKKYETLHGDEIRRQSQYDATREQMRGSGIDNFMRAISGQESGSEEGDYSLTNPDSGAAGRFQIMPSNWSAWAQDAGLPADAPMTPENQERVARNKMLEYYKQYGNWRDVASKWYSGRAVSELSEEDYNAPNYSNGNEYPSISEYVESVMTRFRDISSRSSDTGNENAAYLGENGKGEGKYWSRQSDNVSLEGAHPDLPNAIDMLAKWYYDRTGKQLVVTAGTNGEHADGEHSHAAGWKVDVNDFGFGEDGALTTPEGEKGYLADEFIAYGRSLGLGMNWEGGANNAHIDVALDGTQWDGNGDNAGGFNPNVSTESHANQLYNQRINQGWQRENTPPPEKETKPLFDINAEDPTAQKILEDFLTRRYKQTLEKQDLDQNDLNELEFFRTKFDEQNQFQNTPENRQAVLDRYGDELSSLFQDNAPKVQEKTPNPQTPPQTQQGNRLQQIRTAGRKFLEELNQKQDPAKAETAFKLQNLLSSNKASNIAEIERLLKENGKIIQEQTPQSTQPKEEPVNKNKPPENILPQPQPTKSTSGNEKLIGQASKSITPKTSRSQKIRTGNAVLQLASQNGIAVPSVDFKTLQNGSTKKITEWQEKLAQAGAFTVAQPQAEPKQFSQEQIPSLNARAEALLESTRRENAIASGEQLQRRYSALRVDHLNLDDNEIPAEVGEINPEPENIRVQSLQETQAEQERRRQAQSRQKELRREYDSNTDQIGAREFLGENPENPDEMIGNIAKEFARRSKPTSPPKQGKPQSIKPIKGEPEANKAKSGSAQTAEVITDNRTPYQIKYKVVEAGELNPSHVIDNNGVFANNNYPAELQPRNRERANMQAQLISMANNLNPADLTDARNVNQGAPIIRNDNVVLNGNGRTAAIRYAYELGKANHYKETLIQNAEKFGLNADEVSKMNQPILVRELANDLSREELQDLTTSQTGGTQMGATEKAKADAKKLSSGTIARMPQSENVDLTNAESEDFLRAALNDIATTDELNALTTSNGRISQDGINRVKRALFAKAYGDDGIISQMSESPDDNVRGVTNALLSAAPDIVKVQERMKNGTLHNYDLSAITNAVKKLSELRERGTPVPNYLQEQSLFAEHADSEETKEILATIDKNKRSTKKITDFLKNIARGIQNQGDPRQEALFGKNEKKPLIKLIQRARETAENGDNIPLFSKQGDADTTIDNFVADKDLKPQQKLLKSFGKSLGVQTVFFNNADGRFHGAQDANTVYINVNSKMPLGKVFWHESLHWLKANNPELYKKLTKAAGITDAQRDAYLEETGRNDLEDNTAIDEEILADQMEDVAKRTGLLQSIAGKNRNLIQRVIQWLKDTMNKFIDHFRNPQGNLTTEQATRLADEFGRIARNLKDQNGNKIFHYNNRTHNIELANGRQLSETPFNENELRERVAKGEREGTIKYSVGNDNSSESLWQKLKNVLPFSDKQSKRRRAQITENLRKLGRHRILYGYIDGADDIVVDHLQKLIQSRKTYDWERLLPVVGKEIARNLNLNPTTAQSNYIADWLITGALNNNTAEAKAFAKAMRDNPAMAELLQETRDIFQEIDFMTPEEKLASTLVDRQKKSWFKEIFRGGFTEEVLDDLSPLQELVDKATKNASPAVAQAIKQGVNVKQLAQLSRGRGAIANIMVNGRAGALDEIRAALSERYAGVYFTDFKTINAIIESVGGDWKGLQTYATAKLIKEVYEYNRAHPEDQKTIYSDMKEAEIDQIIKNGKDKFDKAQKDLVRYSKILLAIEYESGMLTDNQYFNIMKSWKNYVPMAQVFDENESYDKFDPLKRRQGHSGDTWSPIQTLIAHTHTAIQACERNKVKLELATLVRFGGFDSNLSEVPKSNPNVDNIITFRENGKMKYLETPDPAIKRAVDAMQSKSESNWLMKMLKATSGFMRAAYTMANPDFAAGNIMRDLPDAFIHNKQLGRTVPIIDMVRAFCSACKSVWTNDADFIEWQTNGGAQASFVSEDVDYIQRSINDATIGNSAKARLKRVFSRNFFSATLDEFQRLSEFTENLTRVASYKMAKNALAKAGVNGATGKQLAALAAREASIDFSKAGRSTRALNKGVLFANAAVQGINQWVEAGREAAKGNTKPLFGKVFRAAVMGIIPAIVQSLFAGADDDRKKEYEQAPDWEKDTYWIFGGIRIPKGMDFGLRLMANMADEAFSSKPFDWSRAFGSPVYNALPSLTATLITPAVEVVLNKSYFRGAPIDPKSEQHLPAHLRRDANTSWTAEQIGGSRIAKFFSDGTGWSPRKLDYLINGYLGFMGRFVTHLPNYKERGIGFDEFPMLRRFIFTPYKNPKVVKEYYEAYDKQEQLYNEYNLTKERPDDYDAALHKRIKASYEKMHNISKQEKLVMQDTRLSHDERKAKLQELEKRRVAICERVFQRAR